MKTIQLNLENPHRTTHVVTAHVRAVQLTECEAEQQKNRKWIVGVWAGSIGFNMEYDVLINAEIAYNKILDAINA